MQDNWVLWGVCLDIAFSLLLITNGAFMKRNPHCVRIDLKGRLTYILMGMGLLLSSFSFLLILIGQSTRPMIVRHIFSWVEGAFIFLSVAMELAALGIWAQRQDQLRNRAQNERVS